MANRRRDRSQTKRGPVVKKRRGWFVGGFVVLVAVAVVVWLAWRSTAELPGRAVPTQGNVHLVSPSDPHLPYNSVPPTSGPHLPYIAPWGIHTTPIAKELQVHNLEDGGVMVQYSCDCPELVAKLRGVVERYRDHVILAPYPGLPQKIALTAWGRIDSFDEFDEARIVRFITAYSGVDHHKR
ncbi:MAG TPA: DUF3105 domain-containing protein [Methylomirabilota bacterium]|nr:DUF3105 domain-containing protein [Methylomirabilota bacterium]